MKKFKLRNKRKKINMKHILLLFTVFVISIGIGYSKFSTDLSIYTTVNR